jgi:hypothetical protein
VPSVNDITGDSLASKVPSKAYQENYDKIFGKKKTKTLDEVTPEEWDKAYQVWKDKTGVSNE